MGSDTLDGLVRSPFSIKGFSSSVSRFVAGGILALSLTGCPMSDVDNGNGKPPPPPPPGVVECPFNPAVEYARENSILQDYDVSGFGTYCFWNPQRDADKNPSSFLDPFEHNRTKDMLDWMSELDADGFYTHDQVQSLVDRFGSGIINPETGQRVEHDTGLVNIDEYLAARDFYEKAKEMHSWATANQHRAESIKPEHYQNFNAWSVRLFGWPFPEPEFDMPQNMSHLVITGLEPSVGFLGYTPVNWGLTDWGTPAYESMNFIGLEAGITGNESWNVCRTNVELNPSASQIFHPDILYLWDSGDRNVLVQSMLYSPGEVLLVDIASPGPPVDWTDMSIVVEYPVSSTLMDIGGYIEGHRLRMHYGHVSGKDGNMYDDSLPEKADIIRPRAVFAYLNSQRTYMAGDFQGYVPADAGIPGPHRPGFGHLTQVDIYYEGLPPGQKAGFNDLRANRHDEPVNYSVAIGNRTFFSPCVREEGLLGDWIHEPK
jgi:hypothetical protein